MINPNNDVDALLKARADIDEQLRLHKNGMTVLFTDVVGSTSFFERNGDTAGLAMIHRHDELTSKIVMENDGRVVKTIGDSVMAEFPDSGAAVHAAVKIQRQFLEVNSTLQSNRRVEVRIGIHTGTGFRKGDDLFGDVVNVAARITKRTGPAQILVSRGVQEGIPNDSSVKFHWLSKITLDGRAEREDIFEVIWTDSDTYRQIRERLSAPSGIPVRYEVLSQLGTGGTGIVYKVRDLETDELVALKMLKPEVASDPAVQENFKRELCLARKITHKNICRLYEFSRSEGRAYTTMELIEGESLLSRLYRVGALPVPEAVKIVAQMCTGLREAHSLGIIHRDLKPANIMIDRSGTVKIMDFGIARLTQGSGQMTGTLVGTPAYMAPEQAELKPVSPSTDIYALGLVMYEMITGTPAFNGDTPIAVALKQIRNEPKRPREIIPNLAAPIEHVILKCLQKDPADRFQSVDQLESALRHAMQVKRAPSVSRTAEAEIRKITADTHRFLRSTAQQTSALLKQWNWRPVQEVRNRPGVMLGVTLLIAGVGAFSVHSHRVQHGSSSAVSGLTEQTIAQNSSSSNSASPASTPAHLSPVVHEEVHPSGASNSAMDAAVLKQSLDDTDNLDLAPTPVLTSRPHRIITHTKASVSAKDLSPAVTPSQPSQPTAEQKVSGTAPASPQVVTPVAQPTTALTASLNSSDTPAKAETAEVADAKDAKTSDKALYLEVATFKDETWAQNAVEKLTSLGFQAFYVHKTKLWLQSYRVEVGPFANAREMQLIQQDLNSKGYKVKPMN